MAIKAGKVIVPALELDKYWVASFSVVSGIVGGGASLSSTLIPYNDLGQTGDPIILDPIDVMDSIQTDPEAAAIYVAILAFLQKKGIEQGKLTPEEE